MTPHKCPVCCGSGRVRLGFYSIPIGEASGTIPETEKCRTCDGSGVVWSGSSPEPEPFYPWRVYPPVVTPPPWQAPTVMPFRLVDNQIFCVLRT